MSTAFWTAATVVALFIGALPTVLSWRMRQLRAMMVCRERFFDAANKLLADDDVPPIVIDHIESMAGLLDNPKFGRELAMAAISGELRHMAQRPSQNASAFVGAIKRMRPELRDLAGTATASALIASTYTNWLLGTLIRRAILFALPKDKEQAELIVGRFPQRTAPPNGAAA